jgi:hypothetical protein
LILVVLLLFTPHYDPAGGQLDCSSSAASPAVQTQIFSFQTLAVWSLNHGFDHFLDSQETQRGEPYALSYLLHH